MTAPGHPGEAHGDSFKLDHDESEEAQEERGDREVAGTSDPRGYRAQIASQCAEASRLANTVDVKANAAETHKGLTSDPPKVPDLGVQDPTPSAALKKKEDALKQASSELGKSQQKDTEWTVGSYLVAVGSVVATGIGVYSLVQYLSRTSLGKPTDDIPALDPKTKAVLDQLSSDWKTISDGKYWERLASYIETHVGELSLGDQLVFMNLTVMLGGYSNGFMWDSTQDLSDHADQLIEVYEQAKSSPAMIRAAATMNYHSEPIPRVVAADLLRLALAWLGVQPSGKVPT